LIRCFGPRPKLLGANFSNPLNISSAIVTFFAVESSLEFHGHYSVELGLGRVTCTVVPSAFVDVTQAVDVSTTRCGVPEVETLDTVESVDTVEEVDIIEIVDVVDEAGTVERVDKVELDAVLVFSGMVEFKLKVEFTGGSTGPLAP